MNAEPDAQALEKAIIKRFAEDFPHYAWKCLSIRPKAGPACPLIFNRSQLTVHRAIERQKKRTGRVRMLVLKSRQVGISTYFCGRSYRATTFNHGFRAFVLTQMDSTTDALFGMVKRFHDGVPDLVRPIVGASNAQELNFPRMDSGYRVATAGNKAVGRGDTVQIFHGSEVSRWPNAEEHVGGVMEAVPDLPGTEVWLESTANGVNNMFHTKWQAAMRREGEFEGIFVPWFWHEEYQKAPSEGDWRPPAELQDYAELHGLTREQTYWAYQKNIEKGLGTGGRPDRLCWLFRQEYPATADEAFQTAGTNSYISGELVLKARRTQGSGSGPIVLGVDVARGGDDKSAIIDRQGRRLGFHVCRKFNYGKDTMPLVGEIVRIVREMRSQGTPIKKVMVDATGVGGPVYDRLKEQLGDELVAGIDFGGRALNRDRYANRRAEIWEAMLQWFLNEAGVSIPDDPALQSDICAPAWGDAPMTRFRSDGTLIMEEKASIKKRLNFSPDYGDAAALTFAMNFDEFYATSERYTPPPMGPGSWML